MTKCFFLFVSNYFFSSLHLIHTECSCRQKITLSEFLVHSRDGIPE